MATLHRSTTGSPVERHRTVRGHDFYPPAEVLARIPGLYGTEPVPTGAKTIWLHYFAGPCDWWVAEYDPASGDAFGYACLGDPDNAEWATPTSPTSKPCTPRRHHLRPAGTVRPLPRLLVERDLDWPPRTVTAARLPGRPRRA